MSTAASGGRRRIGRQLELFTTNRSTTSGKNSPSILQSDSKVCLVLFKKKHPSGAPTLIRKLNLDQ
jgi:hypothetical protein